MYFSSKLLMLFLVWCWIQISIFITPELFIFPVHILPKPKINLMHKKIKVYLKHKFRKRNEINFMTIWRLKYEPFLVKYEAACRIIGSVIAV